jgi:hypothetical protein
MRAQPGLGALARLLGFIAAEPRVHAAAALRCAVRIAILLAVLLAPATTRAAGTASDTTAVAPAFPSAPVRAWQMGLLRSDRLQHASLSFTIAAGATVLTRRPGASFAGTLALGLLKELRDIRHGGFDSMDLAADLTGSLLGASVARAAP